MGELYQQVEAEFHRLRSALEETSGVSLNDIRLISSGDYLKIAQGRPDFNEVREYALCKSPMLFSPSEGLVIANESELLAERHQQKGFHLGFYTLHELCHALQWAIDDFNPLEKTLEEHDARYASIRKEFCEAEQDSKERKEMFTVLENMLVKKRGPKQVLAILKEGFAVYFPLECMDLEAIDPSLAYVSRNIKDALRIHAATGEDTLDMLFPGWEGAYSRGYDFFRRMVELAGGDILVLQDITKCCPVSMEEIDNPELYWEQRLRPWREQQKPS